MTTAAAVTAGTVDDTVNAPRRGNVKGRPMVWNQMCTAPLHRKLPEYVKNLNATRRGNKAAKARNEAINSALIDELGHACGWQMANLYAVVDGKPTKGVKQEPLDTSKMDYAAQQVYEGRQIAWRRLLRQVC
jgi:hypothetical protein